jgi:hypothetical protein
VEISSERIDDIPVIAEQPFRYYIQRFVKYMLRKIHMNRVRFTARAAY